MPSDNSKLNAPDVDIERLIAGLSINMVSLAECLVSPGWRLSFPGGENAAIHYTLAGTGKLQAGTSPIIPLVPHSFVVIPAMVPFQIEVSDRKGTRIKQVDVAHQSDDLGMVSRYAVGTDKGDALLLICGYVRVCYGKSLDIFENLAMPIVEQFDAGDKLDINLQAALSELIAQEIGAGAMTALLVKQVLITILRRSMKSPECWLERFPLLSDPKIARALAEMVADPGADYSVTTLAQIAGLSRSRFMERFTDLVGLSPLAMLRQLRMKEAADMLEAGHLSVEEIAKAVGYSSRTSFVRAFRAIYGSEPTEYRSGSGESFKKQILEKDNDI